MTLSQTYNYRIGSAARPLEAVFEFSDSFPVDLTTDVSRVEMLIRKKGHNSWKNLGTATVVDATTIRYFWSDGDITAPGTYEWSFKLTFSSGEVEIAPSKPEGAIIAQN